MNQCKNCGALYLRDIYESEEGKKEFFGVLRCTNLDDVFHILVKRGIKEVFVDAEEMITIIQWSLANAGNSPDNGKIIREGKMDKFFGIELKLVCPEDCIVIKDK